MTPQDNQKMDKICFELKVTPKDNQKMEKKLF